MLPSGRATSLDRALAGSRYVVLVGEVDVPGLEALRGALADLASTPRYTRMALMPFPHQWIRRFGHLEPPPVRALPEHVADGGVTAILQHVRRRPGSRRPLEVHASARFVAIDMDHGVGDGRFVLELYAAIFEVARGHAIDRRRSGRRVALPLALARTFGMHPRRAAAAKRRFDGLQTTSTDPAPAADRSRTSPSRPSYAVAMAHVNAATETAVTDWRRTHTEGVGNSAVWLYIVSRALASAGLASSDKVMVAFDCRRYLPRRCRVDGNFAIGVEVPMSGAADLALLAARIDGCVADAVPLAAMGLLAVRSAVPAARRTSKQQPELQSTSDRIAVTYTEISRIATLDDLPWSGSDQFFTGLLDPSSINAMTVFNTRVGASRKLSISFHDNGIDPNSIKKAIRCLEDPMQFLAPGAVAGGPSRPAAHDGVDADGVGRAHDRHLR